MVVDFTQNIESLEDMVWNFVLNPDNDMSELRPKNHDSKPREELITMILPKYFHSEDRMETYKLATKFFKQYSKIPNKKELTSYLELNNFEIEPEKLDHLYLFNLKDYNYNYLYQYVKAFILLRNLNVTLSDMMASLKTASVNPENIDSITEKIRNDITNKLSVSFSNTGKGLNFFDPKSHVQIPKIGTPSGFEFFNKTLGGGWNLKTLVVFQGRPKVGKSMVLGNIAARSFMSGNNTGLVTVELADRSYMKRIGSNVLSIPKEDYENVTDEDQMHIISDGIHKIKEEYEKRGKSLGEFEIVEFPTGGASAIDIENYFLRLENTLNKKFKVIVVDYLNLLRPVNDNGAGLYEKVKKVCEELRGVAMRNEWCVISATQIKRDDVDNFDLGMDSVAESFGLVHTVDSLFGLMRSPLESRMKIKIIANRDNGYEESYKFYVMEKDFFRLSEERGTNSEYYSDDDNVNSLQDEIRQEYRNISQPVETVDSNVSTSTELEDDEYDALFNSI
jgi:replicative DNA helicase